MKKYIIVCGKKYFCGLNDDFSGRWNELKELAKRFLNRISAELMFKVIDYGGEGEMRIEEIYDEKQSNRVS